MIPIPETVCKRAATVGKQDWLAALPQLVKALAEDWEISIGQAFTNGTEAFVTTVTRSDGTEAVLKVSMFYDAPDLHHEITVLRLADGSGCARLYRNDIDRGAMLLERLGRSLSQLNLPLDERRAHLTTAAMQLWRRAPQCDLPTGAQKGRWLKSMIKERWAVLGKPCSELVIDHALTCADRRIEAHNDDQSILVHGDIHQWNALEANDGMFKLVDPEGLLAEPEYDLGVILREDPDNLLVGNAMEQSWSDASSLAARTNCDVTAVWEWAVVERVAAGLEFMQINLRPTGEQMLAAAEAVAEAVRARGKASARSRSLGP